MDRGDSFEYDTGEGQSSDTDNIENISDSIEQFLDKQLESGDPLENTVETIADVVHEVASVTDDPDAALEQMLSGISDEDISDAVLQQVEVVDSRMTIDATGSFGNLEYDGNGDVINRMDLGHAPDTFENAGIDVEDTITSLENHINDPTVSSDIESMVSADSVAMGVEKESIEQDNLDSGMEISGSDGVDAGVSDESADIISFF